MAYYHEQSLYILILKTCQIKEFDLIGISVYCKLKNKKQNEPIEFILKVEEFKLNSSLSLYVCVRQ